MKTVTLARKPMRSTAAESVVEWGTGSLNIDSVRLVGHPPECTGQGFRSGKFGGNQGIGDPTLSGLSWSSKRGRWPANVIFQHQTNCEVIGEREVKTGVAVRENSGGKTIFSETVKPPLENMSYGESGKESIPDWYCAEGCPVPDLDSQSGITTSKAHARNNKGSWKVRKKGNTTATVDTPHTDTGGASRFFKQVKP